MLKGFSCCPCALLSVRLSLCVGVGVPVSVFGPGLVFTGGMRPPPGVRELPLGSSLRRPGPRTPDGQLRPSGPACMQPLCPGPRTVL